MPRKVPEVYRYRVDASDHVVSLDALEDGLPIRPIERFLGGGETLGALGDLYRFVRETGRPVRVPFRCDSAGFRRSGTLLLRRRDDLELDVRAAFRRIEPRAYFPFLDDSRPREGVPVPTCRLCSRVRIDEEWCDPAEVSRRTTRLTAPAPPPMEPTICADCRGTVRDRTSRGDG